MVLAGIQPPHSVDARYEHAGMMGRTQSDACVAPKQVTGRVFETRPVFLWEMHRLMPILLHNRHRFSQGQRVAHMVIAAHQRFGGKEGIENGFFGGFERGLQKIINGRRGRPILSGEQGHDLT